MPPIQIGEQAFRAVNFFFVFFNITANIFYGWSFFKDRGQLRQPLKALLGYLVFGTTLYCVFFIVADCFRNSQINAVTILAWIMMRQYSHSTMTCYVWLTFYYYINIVPVVQVFMVWAKKHIKPAIYATLIGDIVIHLLNDTINVTFYIANYNISLIILSTEFKSAKTALSIFMQPYICLCMLIMILSSFSTAHYLQKHIRNFAKASGRLTSPRIRSQVRVTIIGILQGLLYVLYFIFCLSNYFMSNLDSGFSFSPEISVTVATLYLSATTFNIGVGQSIIRQRVADVFRRLKSLRCANK